MGRLRQLPGFRPHRPFTCFQFAHDAHPYRLKGKDDAVAPLDPIVEQRRVQWLCSASAQPSRIVVIYVIGNLRVYGPGGYDAMTADEIVSELRAIRYGRVTMQDVAQAAGLARSTVIPSSEVSSHLTLKTLSSPAYSLSVAVRETSFDSALLGRVREPGQSGTPHPAGRNSPPSRRVAREEPATQAVAFAARPSSAALAAHFLSP